MSIDSERKLIFHSLLLADLPFSCLFPDNLFSQCTAHRSNCAIPSVKCKLLNFESVMMHILISSHLDFFALHQLPSFASFISNHLPCLSRLLQFHVPKSYLLFYLFFFSWLLYSKLLNKHLSRSRANRRLVSHRTFYTQQTLIQKGFYTQKLLHRAAFAHRSFYTKKL